MIAFSRARVLSWKRGPDWVYPKPLDVGTPYVAYEGNGLRESCIPWSIRTFSPFAFPVDIAAIDH